MTVKLSMNGIVPCIFRDNERLFVEITIFGVVCSYEYRKSSSKQLYLTLIRESWKKNPKRGTITERLLRKKNPERSIEKICICLCAVDFFFQK